MYRHVGVTWLIDMNKEPSCINKYDENSLFCKKKCWARDKCSGNISNIKEKSKASSQMERGIDAFKKGETIAPVYKLPRQVEMIIPKNIRDVTGSG